MVEISDVHVSFFFDRLIYYEYIFINCEHQTVIPAFKLAMLQLQILYFMFASHYYVS